MKAHVAWNKHESNVKAMRLHAKLESAIVGALERRVHSTAELSADIQAAVQGPTISSLEIVEESTQLVQPAQCQPKGTMHTLTFHDLVGVLSGNLSWSKADEALCKVPCMQAGCEMGSRAMQTTRLITRACAYVHYKTHVLCRGCPP